jgi:hypothetical protein
VVRQPPPRPACSSGNGKGIIDSDQDANGNSSKQNKGGNTEGGRASASPHPEFDVVDRDIERSLWNYVESEGMGEDLMIDRRRELSRIVHGAMNSFHLSGMKLHYYQGYHDICTVLLLVTGERTAFAMSTAISCTFLGDAHHPDLSRMINLLGLLFPLLQVADRELHSFILESGVPPYFALSWVLTWFSHSLKDVPTVARVFDFMLSSHPLMSLYVSLKVLVHRRTELLACACELSEVHGLLQSMPETMPWEKLLQESLNLYREFPASELLLKDKGLVKE